MIRTGILAGDFYDVFPLAADQQVDIWRQFCEPFNLAGF